MKLIRAIRAFLRRWWYFQKLGWSDGCSGFREVMHPTPPVTREEIEAHIRRHLEAHRVYIDQMVVDRLADEHMRHVTAHQMCHACGADSTRNDAHKPFCPGAPLR